LFALGFYLISFVMKSASPDDLRVLDRQHKFDSIVDCVRWSKHAGFLHINLDLIFSIPGQSRESWRNSLRLALGFGIDHFSVYSLIVEEGTRLKRWIDKGLISEPDDDLGAAMYEDTMDILEQAGYQQYEISNWSREERAQCRHNLQYWRYLPYLGFGAGAHGFFGNIRTENVGSVSQYIQCLKDKRQSDFPASPAACSVITLSQWDKIQENIMMSLRLTAEGVNLNEFRKRYGIALQTIFEEQVRRLSAWGC
jgi:oxygen-independent coproporphyrinogen-3 oxidase